MLRYHRLVYFDLILFYFLVFYHEHYSYQYYSYCEFYIVFTIICNVFLPVCFVYHYLVPLFICIYVYSFIYLFIESRRLATFWCYCYLFYNVPTINKDFLLLLYPMKINSDEIVINRSKLYFIQISNDNSATHTSETPSHSLV